MSEVIDIDSIAAALADETDMESIKKILIGFAGRLEENHAETIKKSEAGLLKAMGAIRSITPQIRISE